MNTTNTSEKGLEAFHATLFNGSPTANNEKARALFEQNIFRGTRV